MGNAEYEGKINMDILSDMDTRGAFEARYVAFLETITHLRPKLHRYCSRMTGSVMDGENVVQDALFEAYRNVWSTAELQAKNEEWQLVCANVFGLQWSQ